MCTGERGLCRESKMLEYEGSGWREGPVRFQDVSFYVGQGGVEMFVKRGKRGSTLTYETFRSVCAEHEHEDGNDGRG